MARLLWPGWCGFSMCPEPLPPVLEAVEPRRLARLDPLAAEVLEPGGASVVAELRVRASGPGVVVGRWSLGLEGGVGEAVLEAVERVGPGVYVVLRPPVAGLSSPGSLARRLARLAGIGYREALAAVEEAVRRLRMLARAHRWRVEAPAAPGAEALMERLVNPPLGFEARPPGLLVRNPRPPRGDGGSVAEEARRLGLAVRRGRVGEPVVRAVMPRSAKAWLLGELIRAVEEGWAPFTWARLDWEPRDPMIVEAALPGGCGRCLREVAGLLDNGVVHVPAAVVESGGGLEPTIAA